VARARFAFSSGPLAFGPFWGRRFGAWALLSFSACGVPAGADSSDEAPPRPAQTTFGTDGAIGTEPARVTQTIRRVTTQLVTLRTSEATVITTPEHPFAKVGGGWTRAADLAVGDRVVTRASRDAAVVEVVVREAPPTPVYNLSVAKTHAYFVSAPGLLVHNVDCAPDSPRSPRSPPRHEPSSAGPSHESRKRKRPEQSEIDAALERARKRHDAAKKKLERLTTPLDDTRDPNNCSSCTLAALSDVPTVSKFIDKYKHVPGVASTRQLTGHDSILVMMRGLGLISDVTPRPADFPPVNAPEVKPFQHWDNVTRFMKESTANTFAISYEYVDGSDEGGHILIAVRQADGSIEYLDFQGKTPKVVDLKAIESIVRVNVIPTNVDWRMNRELYWHVTQNKHRPHQSDSDDSDSEGSYDSDGSDPGAHYP